MQGVTRERNRIVLLLFLQLVCDEAGCMRINLTARADEARRLQFFHWGDSSEQPAYDNGCIRVVNRRVGCLSVRSNSTDSYNGAISKISELGVTAVLLAGNLGRLERGRRGGRGHANSIGRCG